MNDPVKEKILQIAVNLFQRFGYKKTTIEDISREAEIGKGSIYLHFQSKEEILLTLIQNHCQEMNEAWLRISQQDWPVQQKITSMLKFSVAEIQRKKEEISLTTLPPRLMQTVIKTSEETRSQRLTLLTNVLEPLFGQEEKATLKHNTLARVLLDSIHNLVFRLDIDKTFPWEQFLDDLLELVMKGNYPI